jgi:hypothetical protein
MIVQLELGVRQEKVTDHMRDKYAKIDIKLKHNSMNIIAYRVRQKNPRTRYYIGEDRLYSKLMAHSG